MPFAASSRALRAVQSLFDDAGRARQHALLDTLAKMPLPATKTLADFHDTLLFLAAHPADARLAAKVERAFTRLERVLKQHRAKPPKAWEDRGMAWQAIVTRFTHDAVRWLAMHPHASVTLESFGEGTTDLNAVLALTLPSLERSETTAGLSNLDLLDALRVPPRERLTMLVAEFARFDAQPFVKDHFFDALEVYARITPRDARFSKARNRLALGPGGVFHQRDMLKRFDVRALLDTPLPSPRRLEGTTLDDAMRVVKNTMALTIRETDPATYLDPRALRIIDLERGLTCAIFGMTPDRQLPIESYVGFTLFKNGLPVAYGGSWMLGPRADFGMNIFEPYRGGESGFMMTQVLRVYRQTFGIERFEVDAHQFGLDNPDGIASGAYWFYYRHGFRSIDPALVRVADREKVRLAARAGARSSRTMLLTLTGSNVALDLAPTGTRAPTLAEIQHAVTRMIARDHRGDRAAAEQTCLTRFAAATGERAPGLADASPAFREWSLAAVAMAVRSEETWQLVARAVALKADDVVAYQAALLQLMPRLAR